VETRNLDTDGQEGNDSVARRDKDQSSYNSSGGSSGVRFFWHGGLLANTPLRQTYLAHRQYWLHVRKLEYNIPRLKFGIINLHPAKQKNLPSDYDAVVDRKNDIIYHDRTEFDEYVAVLVSDYTKLAESLIKLAEDNGVSKEALQKILNEKTNSHFCKIMNSFIHVVKDLDFNIRRYGLHLLS
jgi:NTE family protein